MKKLILFIVVLFSIPRLWGLENPIFDLETASRVQVGVAIKTSPNAEVYPSFPGRVISIGKEEENETNLGKFIIIEHNDVSLNKYYSLYGMLGEIFVTTGDIVVKRSAIGTVGPSGDLSKIETGATMLFGFFSESYSEALSDRWGEPIFEYKKYWYNPLNVIKKPLPPPTEERE